MNCFRKKYCLIGLRYYAFLGIWTYSVKISFSGKRLIVREIVRKAAMNRPTRRMPNLESNDHVIRWGTASIGSDAQIKLHVIGAPHPILVALSQSVIVGRSDRETNFEVDVDLTAYGAAEQGVSRQHVSLELLRKTVMLTDLNSTNGTFLNDQRVLPQQRRVVRDSDEIRLGKLIIRVYF